LLMTHLRLIFVVRTREHWRRRTERLIQWCRCPGRLRQWCCAVLFRGMDFSATWQCSDFS
jgi:hypothetical protein